MPKKIDIQKELERIKEQNKALKDDLKSMADGVSELRGLTDALLASVIIATGKTEITIAEVDTDHLLQAEKTVDGYKLSVKDKAE